MLPAARTETPMFENVLIDARIAWRNLIRQRARTAFGLAAVIFGVVAVLFAAGFIEHVYFATREGFIRSRLGHIQIARKGYFDSGRSDPFAFVMAADRDAASSLERIGGVASVASRIEFSGLLSKGDHTLSFIGEAIEPEREKAIAEAMLITRGTDLTSQIPNAVILGQGLAANLGAEVGDRLVMMVGTSSGGINAKEVVVRGFFSSASKAFDDVALRINLGAAHDLLRIDGAHLWVLALESTELTPRVAKEITDVLGSERYDVMPWYRTADFYHKTVQLFSRQTAVVKLIIAALIALVIANAVAMSVRERTREIGTGLALGLPRMRIVRQFLLEAALLGAIGGAIGLALGTAVARTVSWVGIPMPPPPGLGRGYVAEIIVTGGLMAETLALAMLAAVLAGLLPAWRVSRMRIVDALRHEG